MNNARRLIIFQRPQVVAQIAIGLWTGEQAFFRFSSEINILKLD